MDLLAGYGSGDENQKSEAQPQDTDMKDTAPKRAAEDTKQPMSETKKPKLPPPPDLAAPAPRTASRLPPPPPDLSAPPSIGVATPEQEDTSRVDITLIPPQVRFAKPNRSTEDIEALNVIRRRPALTTGKSS
jgi:hypothetical protein